MRDSDLPPATQIPPPRVGPSSVHTPAVETRRLPPPYSEGGFSRGGVPERRKARPARGLTTPHVGRHKQPSTQALWRRGGAALRRRRAQDSPFVNLKKAATPTIHKTRAGPGETDNFVAAEAAGASYCLYGTLGIQDVTIQGKTLIAPLPYALLLF